MKLAEDLKKNFDPLACVKEDATGEREKRVYNVYF